MQYILHCHTNDVSQSQKDLPAKTVSRRDQFIDLFPKSIYSSLHDTSPHQISCENILQYGNNEKIPKTPNIRKPLCILTIPKSQVNLALKMTMTPNSFHKQPRPDVPFENTLQHLKLQHVQTGPQTDPSVCKASQCTGFQTARVVTKRCLWIEISIVIIPSLLDRLYC